MELLTPFEDYYDSDLPSGGFYARQPRLTTLSLPLMPWDMNRTDGSRLVRCGPRMAQLNPTDEMKPYFKWLDHLVLRQQTCLHEGILLIADKVIPWWIQLNIADYFGLPETFDLKNKTTLPQEQYLGTGHLFNWGQSQAQLFYQNFPSWPAQSVVLSVQGTEDGAEGPKVWKNYLESMQQIQGRDWSLFLQQQNAPVVLLLSTKTLPHVRLNSPNDNVVALINPRLSDFRLQDQLQKTDIAQRLSNFVRQYLPNQRTSLFASRDTQKNSELRI